MDKELTCGFVAFLGRPNVGKSTLLNRLLGQKVSITSKRPQTTRHRILGIKTTDSSQVIFVDTPGIHINSKKQINKYMNRAATGAVADVDCIVFLIEAERWTDEDEMVLKAIKESTVPVILAINKVDLIHPKEKILEVINRVREKYDFVEVVPISAEKNTNLEQLEEKIKELLPKSYAFYPEDQITDRSDRFLVSEIVREKLMRTLGQEIPYSLTVEIEQFKQEKKLLRIGAIVWVERDSQKAIVIGAKGKNLKNIGMSARKDIEHLFDQKVFLQIWVKVKSGWSDDERALQSLGYVE